jgi:hypothetical protein
VTPQQALEQWGFIAWPFIDAIPPNRMPFVFEASLEPGDGTLPLENPVKLVAVGETTEAVYVEQVLAVGGEPWTADDNTRFYYKVVAE